MEQIELIKSFDDLIEESKKQNEIIKELQMNYLIVQMNQSK